MQTVDHEPMLLQEGCIPGMTYAETLIENAKRKDSEPPHSWRILFDDAFKRTKENWDQIIAHTFIGTQLDDRFSAGYGIEEGCPFTAWSENYVYFPLQYDGSEWVGYVERNPSKTPRRHQGGG